MYITQGSMERITTGSEKMVDGVRRKSETMLVGGDSPLHGDWLPVAWRNEEPKMVYDCL